jgi:hypothetical protein
VNCEPGLHVAPARGVVDMGGHGCPFSNGPAWLPRAPARAVPPCVRLRRALGLAMGACRLYSLPSSSSALHLFYCIIFERLAWRRLSPVFGARQPRGRACMDTGPWMSDWISFPKDMGCEPGLQLSTRESEFTAAGRQAGLPNKLHPKFELAKSMAVPNLQLRYIRSLKWPANRSSLKRPIRNFVVRILIIVTV